MIKKMPQDWQNNFEANDVNRKTLESPNTNPFSGMSWRSSSGEMWSWRNPGMSLCSPWVYSSLNISTPNSAFLLYSLPNKVPALDKLSSFRYLSTTSFTGQVAVEEGNGCFPLLIVVEEASMPQEKTLDKFTCLDHGSILMCDYTRWGRVKSW